MRGWLALIVLLAGGCAPDQRSEQAPAAALAYEGEGLPAAVAPARVDPWMQSVRIAHAMADAARSPAQSERAIEALGGLFEKAPTLPDATPIRHDAAGRIVGLYRRLGQLDQAAAWVERGLAAPGPPTIFTAHLHLEAARVAEDRGQMDAARAARERARAINRELRQAR